MVKKCYLTQFGLDSTSMCVEALCLLLQLAWKFTVLKRKVTIPRAMQIAQQPARPWVDAFSKQPIYYGAWSATLNTLEKFESSFCEVVYSDIYIEKVGSLIRPVQNHLCGSQDCDQCSLEL